MDNTEPGIVVGPYVPTAGTRNGAGWYNADNAPIAVPITVTDVGGAGLRSANTVRYRLDGGSLTSISQGSTDSPFITGFVATEGEVLEVFAYDDAVDNTDNANEGFDEDTDYKVDLTAPSPNIAVNYANRTFSLAPEDATSGIDWANVWYEFVLDDDSIDGPYLYTDTASIPVGAKSLRVRTTDIAGNEDDRTVYFNNDRVISGYLRDYNSTALSGERVVLGGEVNKTDTTDASGYYEFTELDPFGWYVVAPLVKNNIPAGRVFPGIDVNKTNQDFTLVAGWLSRMGDRGNTSDYQFDSSAILTPPLLTEAYSLGIAGTRMLTGVLDGADNKMEILFTDGAALRSYYYSAGAYVRRDWSPRSFLAGDPYNLSLLDGLQSGSMLDGIILCGNGIAVADIYDKDGVKIDTINTTVLTDAGLQAAPGDTVWSTNFGLGSGNILFAGAGTGYNAVFVYNTLVDTVLWETMLVQDILPGTETLCIREAGKPVVLIGSQSDADDLMLAAVDAITGESVWTRVFAGITGKITPMVSITEDGGWEDVIAVRTSTNDSQDAMRVYILNGATGEIKTEWAAPTGTTLPTNTTFGAAIADITNDGKRELAISDGAGNIYLVDTLAGTLIDSVLNMGRVWAAVDFDGNADGKKEIIAAYDTELRILSADLTILVSRDMGENITNVVVSDTNGDGAMEIVVTLPASTSILRASTTTDLPGTPVIADVYSYGGQVYIVWIYVPTGSDISGFRIYRSSNPSDPGSWVLAGTAAADANSFIDSPGAGIYSYRVAAYNDYGELVSSSSVPVEVVGGGSSGSGVSSCFIATAAYGTPMAAEVVKLRNFRDSHLLKNKAGRAFVRWYYRHSPPVAEYIRQRKVARMLVRAGLRPLLWILSF
ncbi:MAG: hypothetical protein JW957_05040 [Candidatus Omnitrophica bacterium]|nr:hypothetical protein [Candidatus Omnitrophota bacterium]